MTIRNILVPVRGDGKGESVINLAIAIAARSNAHIDVVHVHAKPEDLLPFGVPVPGLLRSSVIDAVANTASQEAAYFRKLFDDYCQRHDLVATELDEACKVQDKVTISLREEAGKQAHVITRLGRLADMIVVAKPDREGNLGRNTLEAALFDVRKLTAIAPPNRAEVPCGASIAVAWNGGPESARAVTLALSLLESAEKVTILSGGAIKESGVGVSDLQRYLRCHGIDSEARTIKTGAKDVGGPLLSEAARVGADMLIMGAYGNSQRRELVLGGVTEFVIENAELPVVMAH